MKQTIRKFFRTHIRSKIKNELSRQRLKFLLWDVYGYYSLLFAKHISLAKKLKLLKQCCIIDWNILHAHKPCEITPVLLAILEPDSNKSQQSTIIEAGCWLGGGSAKFSHGCAIAGCGLHVYDSFEGVEYSDANTEKAIFFGTYIGQIEVVKENISRYGNISVCEFHKGWFAHTFKNFNTPCKVVYVDCDLAKGTLEVITAVQPYLQKGGKIFTQDYHIKPIKKMLTDENTWKNCNLSQPSIKPLKRNMALIKFED
ncbi:MAG: TylF/MycF/NovP-related O-methyltransferase [Parafilimonas sp.]